MTLYTQQENNVTKTWLLLASFLALIVAIGYVMSQIYGNPTILYAAIVFSLIFNFFGYWYSDKVALAMARAVPVASRNQNPYLWNLVENLSITAGLPMPRVYILPESQINAFATGRDPKNAALTVTQGAIDRLENEELEGVIAHEMSHIGNRDILVMTVAVVLAGAVAMVSDMFLRASLFGGRGRDREENGSGILQILGIVLIVLAPIFATMMQLAISRKREFLADATGALMTRYPEGLARALEKIGQDSQPLRAASDSTAHMYISNPFKGGLNGLHKLFMTHPPLEERIRILRAMDMPSAQPLATSH
jgi:heat shock protein HtpX